MLALKAARTAIMLRKSAAEAAETKREATPIKPKKKVIKTAQEFANLVHDLMESGSEFNKGLAILESDQQKQHLPGLREFKQVDDKIKAATEEQLTLRQQLHQTFFKETPSVCGCIPQLITAEKVLMGILPIEMGNLRLEVDPVGIPSLILD